MQNHWYKGDINIHQANYRELLSVLCSSAWSSAGKIFREFSWKYMFLLCKWELVWRCFSFLMWPDSLIELLKKNWWNTTNFSKNRDAYLHILSKPYSVKDQIFPKHSEIVKLFISVKGSRVTYFSMRITIISSVFFLPLSLSTIVEMVLSDFPKRAGQKRIPVLNID